MIKLIINLFNFAFKCRLVTETHVIALIQAGMQANQLASVTDHAGNITNFAENRASKGFFFSEDSKVMCTLMFVSHKKRCIWETSIHPNNTYYISFH